MKIVMSCVSCVLFAALASPLAAEPVRWETLEVEARGGKATFELGRLTVPANRATGSDATVDLAFVRLPSTAEHPGDPIVFLNGGPGQAATSMVRYPPAVESLAPLRAIGDVILLDQRGAGMSWPQLECPEAPASPAFFVEPGAVAAEMAAAMRTCAAALREKGIDPGSFNTRESADDLEDLRRALGARRLDLLGFSYGTHLAFAAIRRHGEHLGRVVLIGSEGPDHTWKLPSTFDTQIAKIGLLAAADPNLGDDVPDFGALLRRVLKTLESDPIEVTVADRRAKSEVRLPVGKEGLQWLLVRDIGDTNDLPFFPALAHQIDRGDTTLLAWFVEKRWNQLRGGIPMLYFAMDCASGVSEERRARIEAEAREAILGNVMNDAYAAVCPAAGVPDLGEEFRAPLVSPVPVLFVSGTLDNNTPPFQAEQVRWGMPNARHLIVANAGHEDMLPNPEVQKAIAAFLRGENLGDRTITLPPLAFEEVSASR